MKMDSDSDTDCFVYALVLNFLWYNNEKGVKATVILKFAVKFFESSDIAKSKENPVGFAAKIDQALSKAHGFKRSFESFERHVRTSSKSEYF